MINEKDVLIYNGRHLATVQGVEITPRTTRVYIFYTDNRNASVMAWVSAKKLAPIPDNIAPLPENTRLKIQALKPSSPIHPAIDVLRKIDVDTLGPLEAITKLRELKRIARS